jgi:hypothetical protein
MISLHEGKGPGPKKHAERVMTLRLDIVGCNPPIWRRIAVKESMWLSELHDAIQVMFDWYDYQVHSFVVGEGRFGNPIKRDEVTIEDDRDVMLSDLELKAKDRFQYWYHFGEGWQIEIRVEKISTAEKGAHHPLCTGGERCGPPEDCGGLDAYHDMLACIKEPHTELGQEWIEWLGPNYDPERCDLDRINKAIRVLGK